MAESRLAGHPTDRAIRELAAFRAETGALSFYVDLDRRRRPSWEEVEEAAARLARRARRLPGAWGGDAAGDIEVVLARFGRGFDRSRARGLAVFSCREQNFYRQYVLTQPVPDLVAFGPRFRIAPLEEVLAADTPLLAALVDRQRCRLFRSRAGRTVEIPGPIDRPERGVDTGGELSNINGQTEEALRRHARNSAEALAREAVRRPGAPVLIGGTEPAVSALQRALPPAVHDRVAGDLPVAVGAPLSDVAAALSEARRDLARQVESQAVQWICDLATEGHGAVAGLGPALASLRQHRVDTLILSRTMDHPAAVCSACGWLGEPAAGCPECGSSTEPADGFDLSVEEAAVQRARVVFADQPRLDALGGIAVLERF